MLGELVAICTCTVSATVILIALVASAFSIYMGMRELSRRADAALQEVPRLAAHAAELDIGNETNPLNFLRLDPDLEHALVLAPDGKPLLVYNRAGDSGYGAALTAAATLPDGIPHVEHWSLQKVVIVAAVSTPASLAGATILLDYSTASARTRGLCQFLLYLCSGLAGLILIATLLRVAFARRMKPLHDLVRAMGALVDARYDVAVPALSRRDEIGAMAAAVQTFKTRLLDRDRLQTQADTMHASAADRHARITREVDHFQSTIRHALDEVAGCSDQMTVAADSLTSIATQSSGRANEAVAAIRQTTSSVTSVATAAEGLSASIQEVERQADQTRAIVVEATHLATRDRQPDPGAQRQDGGDRRDHRSDPEHCRADEPALAQRHDRGGAGRREWDAASRSSRRRSRPSPSRPRAPRNTSPSTSARSRRRWRAPSRQSRRSIRRSRKPSGSARS